MFYAITEPKLAVYMPNVNPKFVSAVCGKLGTRNNHGFGGVIGLVAGAA